MESSPFEAGIRVPYTLAANEYMFSKQMSLLKACVASLSLDEQEEAIAHFMEPTTQPMLMIATMMGNHFQHLRFERVAMHTTVIDFLAKTTNVFKTQSGRHALVQMTTEMSYAYVSHNEFTEWSRTPLFKDMLKVLPHIAWTSLAYDTVNKCITVDMENLKSAIDQIPWG